MKATHIKSLMHHELLRYATIGYIINFGGDLWVVYSQLGDDRPLAAEVVKLLGNLQRGSEFNFTATASETEEEMDEGALSHYQPLTLLIHKFSQ